MAMGDPAGAALVVMIGVTALVAGFVLGVLLYRLDRDAHGEVVTHARRRETSASAPPRGDRRPRAA
jgi:hypothetical protein